MNERKNKKVQPQGSMNVLNEFHQSGQCMDHTCRNMKSETAWFIEEAQNIFFYVTEEWWQREESWICSKTLWHVKESVTAWMLSKMNHDFHSVTECHTASTKFIFMPHCKGQGSPRLQCVTDRPPDRDFHMGSFLVKSCTDVSICRWPK